MTDKWNLGPPPHIGWWKASHSKREDFWRWWDGLHWSIIATPVESPDLAGNSASYASPSGTREVYWCHDWPKNARVPRYVP